MNEEADRKLSQLRLKSCTDYPTCKLVSLQMFEKYCSRSTLKNMCPTYCIDECKPNNISNNSTVPLKSTVPKIETTRSSVKLQQAVKMKSLETTTESSITTSTVTTTKKTNPASTSSFRIYIPKEPKIAQIESVKNATSEAPSKIL